MTLEQANLDLVRRYLAAIEDGTAVSAFEQFFTPDVVQEEFPNRLVPNGARRTLDDMLEGARRGRKVMTKQRYEVVREIVSGNHVALEVRWSGTLAIPFGSLAEGDEMRARFAVFFEMRDGRIAVQHNYDCFDPW